MIDESTKTTLTELMHTCIDLSTPEFDFHFTMGALCGVSIDLFVKQFDGSRCISWAKHLSSKEAYNSDLIKNTIIEIKAINRDVYPSYTDKFNLNIDQILSATNAAQIKSCEASAYLYAENLLKSNVIKTETYSKMTTKIYSTAQKAMEQVAA